MPLTIGELTATTLDGSGVFDVLMRSVKAHLDSEFTKNRIKGPEYSTVYLGSVELAMRTGLEFLLNKDKQDLENQLLTAQIELANVQVEKAQAELAILEATQLKVPAEIALLEAQTAKIEQETNNAVIEGANLTKQGLVLTAQQAHMTQQTTNLVAEALNIPKQGAVLDGQASKLAEEVLQVEAQTGLITQNTANAVTEGANLTKQGLMLDTQRTHVAQQTTNLVAEALNIPKQGLVLEAQECKLKAEFDLIVSQTLKSTEEIALLTQKTATEKAQTQTTGVDADSVVGKQKALYQAQADGFKRDAEQKAAKLMVDTWSVRRTTDEGVGVAGNGLDDAAILAVVTKLRAGIGA